MSLQTHEKNANVSAVLLQPSSEHTQLKIYHCINMCTQRSKVRWYSTEFIGRWGQGMGSGRGQNKLSVTEIGCVIFAAIAIATVKR